MNSRTSVLIAAVLFLMPARAGAVLFDFDNAPQYAGLPIDVTVDGITAHLSATGSGFSVQAAGVLGFTPTGFSGLCIYPNSIYAADLLISFSTPITDFSIMYAPEEYGCGDNSATMRVTGYSGTTNVGTNTTTAPVPGTWPTGTLTLSAAQGFDNVVVHYDSPPACTDIGPIFMADNMNVTPSTVSVAPGAATGAPTPLVFPNPFRGHATVRFSLAQRGPISVAVYDAGSRLIRTLAAGSVFEPGVCEFRWDGRDDHGREAASGVYLCRVTAEKQSSTTRMVYLRNR
jgi:hypothetical protein